MPEVSAEARRKYIADIERQVLKNHKTAFKNAEAMQEALRKEYEKSARKLREMVRAMREEVEKNGGKWDDKSIAILSRASNLFDQINEEIQKLGGYEVGFMKRGLKDLYVDQYLRSIYTIGKGMDVSISYDRINPRMVEEAISYPWSGAMFSDRIWDNKALLVKAIREGITQSMILGENLFQTTKRMNEVVGSSYLNCQRVVRTESMRVAYVAERHAMEDEGIQKVQYLATIPSERTCRICGADHKKEFVIGKEKNLPRHPNCRCTYIPIIPSAEEAFKDANTETYEEWRKKEQKRLLDNEIQRVKMEEQERDKQGYLFRGSTSTRPADIVNLPNGTRVVIPKDLDVTKQGLTVDLIQEKWKKIPDKLKENVEEIQILDYRNPDDSYWEKTYNMAGFSSYATGGNGQIHFYEHKTHNPEEVEHTLLHEAGHNLDRKYNWLSRSGVWEKARKADLARPETGTSGEWVSRYVTSSKAEAEDFADSVAEFVAHPDRFEANYPNRFNILMGLF